MNEGQFPFRVERIVRWGECDPAGIIYTPRAIDMATEVIEDFIREVAGLSWYTQLREGELGSPTVRLECDYLKKVECNETLIFDVHMERVGNKSLTFLLIAHNGNEEEALRVRLVSCFIARKTFKPTEIPAEVKERLLAYQRACGDE